MDNQALTKLQHRLDALQRVPDDEFWFACDRLEPLGYAPREIFVNAIQRDMPSFERTEYELSDHFRGVTNMVWLANGVKRVHAPKLLADDSSEYA